MKSWSLSSALLLVFVLVLATALALPLMAAAAEPEVYTQHRDGVLGTSLDLRIHGAPTAAAEAAVAAALDEIARLDAVFSSYRDDSELMQLNRQRSTAAASPELLEVLQACLSWEEATGGRFSCRLGPLLTLWREAEAKQQIPERPAVRALARELAQAEFLIDAGTGAVQLAAPLQLDLSGIATGYIIDRIMGLLRTQLPEATAIKLDIGGDAFYWQQPPGQPGWQVGVANPLAPADNAGFFVTLQLRSQAVTASGHASRKRSIARREFSHILVARDGWPVENGTSSVVVAASALVADVVATALATHSLSDGIDWVNTQADVEALLIDSTGLQLHSKGWPALQAGEGSSAVERNGAQLTLDYTLPAFNVADYNRPYVAIWISDTAQAPLRTLLLLGETERWARENARWWRRVGRRTPGLLDGVARPTRGPGEYRLLWDGRDDFGNALPPGDYLLHLEASRENGGSTYKELPFVWGGTEAVTRQLAPDGELGALDLRIANGQATD